MTTIKPANQICPVCGFDDDVTVQKVDDTWVMLCEGGGHPTFEWKPTVKQGGVTSHRSGLGEDLGVYDTLLECVAQGPAEHGVMEYRFNERDPTTYDFLVQRYGHRAQKLQPAPKYTASSFLGSALGQLWREGLIAGWMVKATGYWSYNSKVGGYGPLGTQSPDDVKSWVDFAAEQGIDPGSWPPIEG